MLPEATEPLTWWEVDADIRLAVEEALDHYNHAPVIKRVTYARLAPEIIAAHLRSGRDSTELLAQMFEQRVLQINVEDQY